MNKIVIIEDHQLMAKGMKAVIEESNMGSEVLVMICATFESALDSIKESRIPVTIFMVDANLDKGKKGSELFPFIKKHHPQAKIITTSTEPDKNEEAIALGAHATWSKTDEPGPLLKMLKNFLNQ